MEEEERERNTKRLDENKRHQTKQGYLEHPAFTQSRGPEKGSWNREEHTFPAASKHNIRSTQNRVEKIMTFLSGQLFQK